MRVGMSMTWAQGRAWMVWLHGVVSPVDASGRDEGVALTPLVALCLFHERLQRWVCALRGSPSDDAAWGRLEVLAGVHEHVHLGAREGGHDATGQSHRQEHAVISMPLLDVHSKQYGRRPPNRQSP